APLGGMVISEELHQELYEKTEGNFWHGYTYSGHPTAAAVAMKNLEIIKEENLMDNVNEMGQIMLEGLKWIKEQHSQVSDVRGIVVLGAISFHRGEGADARAPKLVSAALDRSLLCRSVVYGGKVILAFEPPFIINIEQIDDMIQIVNDAIQDVFLYNR